MSSDVQEIFMQKSLKGKVVLITGGSRGLVADYAGTKTALTGLCEGQMAGGSTPSSPTRV